MKIISWNVNGIRAACTHGFWDFFRSFEADIICLQEVKAMESEIPHDLFTPNDHHLFVNSSQTPGRSGVAVYTKTVPEKIETKIGFERFDSEGRLLKLTFPQFTLINLYLPHGGRLKENLDYKLAVYDYLLNNLGQNTILVGDFNIAHEEIDLSRPKENINNIMFTPEERAKIDQLISLGFVDTFRMFNQEGGNYTWYSYMLDAREKGLGWRLDYAFVSQNLAPKVRRAFILPEPRCSDHVPIGLEISV